MTRSCKHFKYGLNARVHTHTRVSDPHTSSLRGLGGTVSSGIRVDSLKLQPTHKEGREVKETKREGEIVDEREKSSF